MPEPKSKKAKISARELLVNNLRFFRTQKDIAEAFIDRTIFELLTLERKLGANIKIGFKESSNKEIESIKGIIEIKKLLYQIYKDNPEVEVTHIDIESFLKDLANEHHQS